MTIGIGNGCLAFAELWVPSGLAAIFITTSPFWMVGVEALLPGGERLHGPTIAGMLVGCTGSLLLVARGAFTQASGGSRLARIPASAIGMLWMGPWLHSAKAAADHRPSRGQRSRAATRRRVGICGSSFVPTSRCGAGLDQKFLGGGVSADLRLHRGIQRLYLLAREASGALISLYNYVNPIVAVCLGWLFYREPIGWREFLALAIILTGVAIAKSSSAHVARRGTPHLASTGA